MRRITKIRREREKIKAAQKALNVRRPFWNDETAATWFAVSVLFAFDDIEEPQSRWHVWEDVVLIEASSEEELTAKTRAYGEATADANAKAGLDMSGQLAFMRFIGVRKIVEIANPTYLDIEQSEHPPVDGTEITFSEFIVESRDDLEKLAKGEEVSLIYAGEDRAQLRAAEGLARSGWKDVRLSQREITYLKSTTILPTELARRVAGARSAGNDRYVLLLSRELAEQFRDSFTLRLAKAGFGPDDRPTAEGQMLETLIDRFFLPWAN